MSCNCIMEGTEKTSEINHEKREGNTFEVVLQCSLNSSGETQCQIIDVRKLPDTTPNVEEEQDLSPTSPVTEGDTEVQSCEESVGENFVERGSERSQ